MTPAVALETPPIVASSSLPSSEVRKEMTARRSGRFGAMSRMRSRCALSVVTTTAPESFRMYSTSALWSFGSSGTTPTPAPLHAR